MSVDWLGQPLPEKGTRAQHETALVPRVTSRLAIPADVAERNALVEKAWEGLTNKQQVYLDALRRHQFNVRATMKALRKTGDAPNRATVYRWAQEDQDYMLVLKVAKAILREEIVDPDSLLLRANDIAEQALAPKPILYKGKKTGFFENHLDTALRANEQLMKTQKMLGNDDTQRQFAEGPAFIIQVVQADGALVNVAPHGVTVDLPGPEDGA